MSKSLVTLAEESVRQSAEIEIALIEAGGELTPELEAKLADINVQLPEKVENYSLLMDRMTALSEFYDGRAEMLTRMSKAALAVVDRCKTNLQVAMVTLDTDEIVGIDVRFKLQNSPPKVVIENEENLDQAYVVLETVKKIDKKRIAADLKLDLPVRGARLEIGKSLRQYANTPGRKS